MLPKELLYPSRAIAPAATPPVFLHTGWRTRGTWIWSRFRAMSGTACYYEPLAEALADLRPTRLTTATPGHWPSGHPALALPYFAEYQPFMRRTTRGIIGYERRFATADFFAAADTSLPGLQHYIQSLLRTAHAAAAQPVLKFCRSLGRVGWMQQHFPQAVHVAVLRNPLAQFASAQRQFTAHGNSYFLVMPWLLLGMHQHLPQVAAVLRHLEIAPPHPTHSGLPAALASGEAALRQHGPACWYRVFLAFWVVSALAIPNTIDLLIDSDLLTRSSAYRQRIQHRMAMLSGLTVDLDEAQASAQPAIGLAITTGIGRPALWRAHQQASEFLADIAGADWAEQPMPGRIGALLAHATLLGLPTDQEAHPDPWSDADFGPLAAEDHCGRAQDLHAEQRLAALYGSHSWRITAPLRWLAEHLRREG